MKPRVFVLHVPREKDGDDAIGFCGRFPRERPDSDYVERTCGSCARIAQQKGVRIERAIDLERDLAELAGIVRNLRSKLGEKLPELDVSSIRKFEERIRAALEKVDAASRELRRLDRRD